jgi:signal transduction histidine kinase
LWHSCVLTIDRVPGTRSLGRAPGASRTDAPVSRLLDQDRPRYLLTAALVVIAYFVGAKLGLHLAFANKNVTAVWPPTGIAVAALLLLGLRLWPSVAIGAFVSNLSNGAGWETSALITVGNTLAPVVAWLLIRRVARAQLRLERVPDVASVFLLGGPVAMTISATLGTVALASTTPLAWSAYGSTWLTWWVGDAMGVVIVAPLALIIAARCWRSVDLRSWRGVEAVGATACVAAAATLAFNQHLPLTFLVLPVATWAAVRFYQLGAGLAVAIVAAISITATVNGHGPLVHGLSTTASLVTLQAFNGALALTTFMLAAASIQHARARAALRADADDLARLLHQERSAALEDMSAVVSHDLRSPLGTIANAHHLLRAELDHPDADTVRLLELAETATDQAVALTEQILDYRRPRDLELAEVDLREIIQRAVDTTPTPSWTTLSVTCEPIEVRVDPRQLSQVLSNLIANACQAMTGPGVLEITGVTDGDTVVITVADSGPGFDPANVKSIFEPFFSTKPSGTGLGLAIVDRIVRAHGGEVIVENRPDGGASIRIVLPRGLAR